MLIQLLMGCRDQEDLLHHIFQCLSQLASMSGVVFETDKDRALYMTVFASELLEYIKKYYQKFVLNGISTFALYPVCTT